MTLSLYYRRESQGSKAPQSGAPQRKPSTDSIERYSRMFLLVIFRQLKKLQESLQKSDGSRFLHSTECFLFFVLLFDE